MDVHRLKVFTSVFGHGSISRASEELKLSQPTVSEHIMVLERELGVVLFDRIGRGIVPTSAAAALYHRAVDIIARVDELSEAVRSETGDISGEVHLGASTIPAAYLLPKSAAGFIALHPGVTFRVAGGDTASIAHEVASGELPLGIIGAKSTERGLAHEPYVKDQIVLVAGGASAHHDSATMAELVRMPFVLREEGSGTRKVFEEYLKGKGVSAASLNVTALLGSTESVKEAVRHGLGVSVVSRFAVAAELESGAMKEVRVKGLPRMTREFYVVTRKGRTLPRAADSFREFLLKEH